MPQCHWRFDKNGQCLLFTKSTCITVALLALFITADRTRAQSTRRPIQAAQACNDSTLILSCPRGESIRIWQYGYVPPEVDCSRALDYNFEIGKDSVSYYSNRFVSVARNAQPNLHAIVRSCNGQQRCKLFVKIPHESMAKTTADPAADMLISPSSGGTNEYGSSDGLAVQPNDKPGIRVLFSCELVQNYGIPSVRSICDRFEFSTSGRFHLRSPGYPGSAHRSAGFMGRRHVKTSSCSCELRSNYGFNLVVIEMELANGVRSGYTPNTLSSNLKPPRDAGECSSSMRFWNASGHVGILPCVFEPKLRINWHDVIKQQRMGMSLDFTNDAFTSDNEVMTRFWFEIQPRRSYTCPVFGCSLHECSGDADCYNPQHSCCCDSSAGLRVCKSFSPNERIEQGILNISCNKMVYSEANEPQLPPEAFDGIATDSTDLQPGNNTFGGGSVPDSAAQPADDVLLGVVIGCGMFFAFMLLGASVFIYCYCRAQRSAGSLGVRPRLSKIGDQWSTLCDVPAANRNNSSANERYTSGTGSRGPLGGYVLKNQPSSGKFDGRGSKDSANKLLRNGADATGGNKQPGGLSFKAPVDRNPSFDGESSFVDFDHDSNKNNSHEQSVESRHVVGECLLKMPEDRLHLLGNNNSVVCGEKPFVINHNNTAVVAKVGSIDASLVATATAASAVAAEQQLLEEVTKCLAAAGSSFQPPPLEQAVGPTTAEESAEDAALLLPIVVKCEVLASSETTAVPQTGTGGVHQLMNQRHLLIEAAATSAPEPTSNANDDVWQQQEFGCGDDNRGMAMTSIVKPSASSSSIKSSPSTSSSSQPSSPVTSSVIYETLLINPPLSLVASNKTYAAYQQMEQQPRQQVACPNSAAAAAAPHRRFAAMDQRDKANGIKQQAAMLNGSNNGSNASSQQVMNHSTSKDSLSSVSGIIKLDIISAF